MENKEFEHQIAEECKLSHEIINTKKDKYCVILDCEGREINSIGFYKRDLITDLIKGNLKIVQDAVRVNTEDKITNMAKVLLQKVGVVNV